MHTYTHTEHTYKVHVYRTGRLTRLPYALCIMDMHIVFYMYVNMLPPPPPPHLLSQ